VFSFWFSILSAVVRHKCDTSGACRGSAARFVDFAGCRLRDISIDIIDDDRGAVLGKEHRYTTADAASEPVTIADFPCSNL